MLLRRALLGAAAVLPLIAAAPAAAAPPHANPAWHDGPVSVFPNNALTVRDPGQLTGLRVNLPLPNCGAAPTDCNTIRLLNQLDGFDLDPRIALTFGQDVDPAQVAAVVRVERQDGRHTSTGVDRVVYDRASHTVYAHPQQQLDPGSRYAITMTGVRMPRVEFTTESATAGLLDLRAELDDGSAYSAAGIPPSARGLTIDADVPAAGTTLAYKEDHGSTSPVVPVPNTSGTNAGRYIFGSYQAPSWLNADSVIPQQPTRSSEPQVTGKQTLPFVLIVPAGTAPAGGWPVAVFGHGFTRDDRDMFLAADVNAARGIATIATDVVGHGYGPRSAWEITTNGATTEVPAHARGVDQNADGSITNTEGVSAPVQPAFDASVSSRDGLRQTVADLMTLDRAIAHGGVPGLDGGSVSYYGQSFGGIYGTMLGGVDPRVPQLALNVDGGPVSEIARLSPAFRLLVTQDLAGRRPSLLNSTNPAVDYFVESMPLRGQPPVTDPAPGALAIQNVLAQETWLDRSGSPETYAPLLRQDPPKGSAVKRVIFQNAYGDQTVPNPTTYTVLAAGGLFDRESLYRNDRNSAIDPATGKPFSAENPHGFLLNPFNPASREGQQQIVTFFTSGGTQVINPDPALWEVPISDPAELLTLHYAAPWAS